MRLLDQSIDHGFYMFAVNLGRDIMEGRHSELESQTGAVVRMGQEVGVETPINTFIYHSLLPQELKAQGQLDS